MTEEVYSTVKRQVEKYSQILKYYEDKENKPEIERNEDRISEAIEGLSKLHPSEEGGHEAIKFKGEIEKTIKGLKGLSKLVRKQD